MKQKLTKLLGLILVTTASYTSIALSNQDYNLTRKVAIKIFADHPETLYCGCQYTQAGIVNSQSCALKPNKHSKRAARMELEHMMPMENAGRHLKCWQDKICTSKTGKQYRGRACCKKISAEFRQMESELLNLWPSVGLINQRRSNFRFTEFSIQEKLRLGKVANCEFWLDSVRRKVEPRDAAKGIVARANLFMAAKYHIHLSRQQRKLFESWHKKYPPTAWEVTWNHRIKDMQGYGNTWITK